MKLPIIAFQPWRSGLRCLRSGMQTVWGPVMTRWPIATMSSAGSRSKGEFLSLRARRRAMAISIDFSRLAAPSPSLRFKVWKRCSEKDCLIVTESGVRSAVIVGRSCSPSNDCFESPIARLRALWCRRDDQSYWRRKGGVNQCPTPCIDDTTIGISKSCYDEFAASNRFTYGIAFSACIPLFWTKYQRDWECSSNLSLTPTLTLTLDTPKDKVHQLWSGT
jgi:hypothetical protein